jgi:hypothetical protein
MFRRAGAKSYPRLIPHSEFQTQVGDPGRIRTCDSRINIPLQLSLLPTAVRICGLDYIFAISGAARIVSTEPA